MKKITNKQTDWKAHSLNRAELKRLHEGYQKMLESLAIAERNKPARKPLPNVIINRNIPVTP